MAFIGKLLRDQNGTSAVEYGIICGVMVVGLLAGIQSLGADVGRSYNDTSSKVLAASQQAQASSRQP